jgi:hypothetical protein
MKQLNFRGHHAAGVAQASEAFLVPLCMEAVAQRSRARGTPTLADAASALGEGSPAPGAATG